MSKIREDLIKEFEVIMIEDEEGKEQL